MTKYVYAFSEGNKDMRDLLGGKGANLAEMTSIGLPVQEDLLLQLKHVISIMKMVWLLMIKLLKKFLIN